jgi:hypothetical protein
MTTNRVSATLNTSNKEAIMAAIETIKTNLPFLISLTLEERKALPKSGDRTRGFILNALEVAQHNDECLPRAFDTTEMQKDIKLIEELYPILMNLNQLQSMIADTYATANSEAYTAALRVYTAAKSNATLPGMKTVVAELKQQFAHRNQKATTPATPSAVKSAANA